MFFKNKIKKVHGEELFTCPRCNVKMEKLKKNDIIIDICKECKGMWLDDGEVQKLAEMSKDNKAEMSKDNKAEMAKNNKNGKK